MSRWTKFFNELKKHPEMGIVNAMALLLVIQTVGSTCAWYAYQPEVPESARKFAKER